MKIDKTTGKVIFAQTAIGGAELTKREFLDSNLGRRAKAGLANKEWEWFYFTLNENVDEWTLACLFQNDKIAEIHLRKVDPNLSWENWTEEKEIHKKTQHDRILESTLGSPPYQFAWGEVVSSYDVKSGVSGIVVRYQKPSSSIPREFIIHGTANLKVRKAHSLNEALKNAIIRVCERNNAIRTCFLLDAKKEDADEPQLLIAVLLDNNQSVMPSIVKQLQDMLLQFPLEAQRIVIISGEQFKSGFDDAKIYSRYNGSISEWIKSVMRRIISK